MGIKERLFSLIIILIFIILTLRLWQIQIIEADKYKKLSEQNRIRIIKIPAPRGIIYDRNGIPLVENTTSFSVSVSYDYVDRINTEILSKILNIPEEELKIKLEKKPESIYLPVKIKQDLTLKEIAMLEARKTELPGIIIETDIKRSYPFSQSTSHLLGYLGKVTEEQISKDPSLREIPSYFMIGQTGIEKIYDEKLRGIPGEKIVEVDALGRELRLIKETQPIKGEDIYLTIDILMQESAYQFLEGKEGAFVAVKAETGEVLAMVSTPSFDSNRFAEGISLEYWSELTNNSQNPLLNRTIHGLYAPGSTFKIITALAGLEEDMVTPERVLVNCTGGINFGKWTFGCWRKGGHGGVNLRRAIVESCDVYFYELGRILGIKRLHKYATLVGLGSPTGLKFFDEKSGLVPNEDWKKNIHKTEWFLGDTFNTAIGQGYLKVTPLQMAMVIASIVNGGIKNTPYIIKGEKFTSENLNFKKKNIEFIKNALSGVVNEPTGTAFSAHSSLVNFGGKTGTVQVVSKKIKEKFASKRLEHHAWFVGFTPVEKPEIAFSIIIEHGGSGGGVAAPIAKNILETYINKKRNLYVKN